MRNNATTVKQIENERNPKKVHQHELEDTSRNEMVVRRPASNLIYQDNFNSTVMNDQQNVQIEASSKISSKEVAPYKGDRFERRRQTEDEINVVPSAEILTKRNSIKPQDKKTVKFDERESKN